MLNKSVNAEIEEVVNPLKSNIKINLQLFAEPDEEDLSDEGWEDYTDEEESEEEEEIEDSEELEDGNDDESEEEPEVAEPDKSKAKQSKQSKDDNAIYAKMRRKAEAEAAEKLKKDREELESERFRIEQEKRLNSISQEKIWEKADEEGLTEEAARKMLMIEEKEKMIAEREKRIQRTSEIEGQKNKLKGQRYFKELEPEIDKFLSQYPDTTVEGAFHYLRSVKLDELLDGKIKATEKRTIANMQDKARRGNVSSDNGDTGKFKSTGLTKKISERWGFSNDDVQEIEKHVSKRRKELQK